MQSILCFSPIASLRCAGTAVHYSEGKLENHTITLADSTYKKQTAVGDPHISSIQPSFPLGETHNHSFLCVGGRDGRGS